MNASSMCGINVVAGWVARLAGLSEDWRYMASPALWLIIAAAWSARGMPERQATLRAWKSWGQVHRSRARSSCSAS